MIPSWIVVLLASSVRTAIWFQANTSDGFAPNLWASATAVPDGAMPAISSAHAQATRTVLDLPSHLRPAAERSLVNPRGGPTRSPCLVEVAVMARSFVGCESSLAGLWLGGRSRGGRSRGVIADLLTPPRPRSGCGGGLGC